MHDVVCLPVPFPPSPPAALEALPESPGRFLLESVSGPEAISRRSILGACPFAVLRGRGRSYVLEGPAGTRRLAGNPFDLLEALLATAAGTRAAGPAGLAPPAAAGTGLSLPPFLGGAVGYLAYDLGRQVERLPAVARDDLGLPELWFGLHDAVVVLDHGRRQAAVVARLLPGREKAALRHAERLRAALEWAAAAGWPLRPDSATCGRPLRSGPLLRSTFTRAGFEAAVARARAYIAAGDIFQVNLAQRFTASWTAGAWALYRRLREVNPAPFAAFLDCGSFAVVSASPERFLQVDAASRRVETRPIKGTRPRAPTPGADARMARALLESEKDRAELVMIVDLERNDLGRVCETGSVRVPDLRRLEGYPTVWHTVATVEGRLRPDAGVAALLRATFPGGSITGAPKVRAMEIIEELEPVRRGIYTGSVGWIGWDGAMDLNIAIRTFTVAGRQAHFHAGGGIVADSDPAAEYRETLHKAVGLVRALGGDGAPEGEVDPDALLRMAE